MLSQLMDEAVENDFWILLQYMVDANLVDKESLNDHLEGLDHDDNSFGFHALLEDCDTPIAEDTQCEYCESILSDRKERLTKKQRTK